MVPTITLMTRRSRPISTQSSGPARRSRPRRHLEVCRSCEGRLGSLSRAARTASEPPAPPDPETRRRLLERALEAATVPKITPLPMPPRRWLAVTSWAAALLVVAGGGAVLWHFHEGSTSTSSSAPARMAPVHGSPSGGPARFGPRGRPKAAGLVSLELRLVQGLPDAACVSPSSSSPPLPAGVALLYDASASASGGKSICARVGVPIALLSHPAGARVTPTANSRLASLSLSVSASSEAGRAALVARYPGRLLAVVSRDEVIGYLLDAETASRRLTIVEVPVGLARKLAGEINAA